MESIDDILAEVKAEYLQPAQPLELKKQLFTPEQLFNSPLVASTQPASGGFTNSATSPEQSLLDQVRSEFEEEIRAKEVQRQQQLHAEQLRQREAIAQQAKEWLKQLDPLSEEGLWFEEFAYAYPSKLEAAIDYLTALTSHKP